MHPKAIQHSPLFLLAAVIGGSFGLAPEPASAAMLAEGICFAQPEICDDGIDNDCDDLVDEGCEPVDPVDYGRCPVPQEFSTCTIDLGSGAFECDNGTPLSLVRFNAYGPVYALDMSDWDVAVVDVELVDPKGYTLHMGNSPSNNGWSGDSSQFSNDSEAQLYNGGMKVYRSDRGGSGLVLDQAGAVPKSGGAATMVVCDGYFKWDSDTMSTSVSDAYIFQIDGDEPDPQAGGINDQRLWLGVDQTVGSIGRNGTQVTDLTVTFGR